MSVSRFPMVDEQGAEVRLTGKWIAPPGRKPENYTFLARKEFALPAVPERAVARVTADSRYVLWVNGLLVGQGPARGSHRRYFFDSYDIASGLRRGRNHLAVQVHCPNRPTYTAAPIVPALFLQLEDWVGTDSSWETRADPAHRSDALLYTSQIGFSEYRDLRREPAGWQTGQDGKRGWTRARELSRTPQLDGRRVVPRDIPALTDDAFRPVAVAASGCVPWEGEEPENNVDYATLILQERHFQAPLPRFENLAALCAGGAARLLPSPSGRGAYCILDFRREVLGTAVLDLDAPEGTIVDVAYGESLSGGRIVSRMGDYRFADRYIWPGGRRRIEHRLHDRGLRLMQVVFRRFKKPITLHGVDMVHRVYPIPMQGSFECDQEFLNRLWTMCGNTISTCSSDTFMDCPWREQALWLNDTLVEMPLYFTLTNDRVFPSRNLRVSADGALPNGLIPAVYPSGRKCLFPSLGAIWPITLSDYFLHTGDRTLLSELLPAADRSLSVYDRWRGKDGLVPDQKGMWNFIDWGYSADSAGLGGTSAALNVIIAAGYKRAALLHEALGNADRAAELQRLAGKTMQAVIRKFWLPRERRLYDCTEPPFGFRSSSQHPHGVALYFGLLDDAHVPGAIRALLDPGVVPAELYFQHFVVNSLARHGRAAEALAVIRRLWGPMVAEGSPTVWETIHGPDGFTGCASLCHGFACTPMYFMHRTLLGVQPLRPGYDEFTLAPQPLGLLRAQGDVPTPHGPIRVSWVRDSAERAPIIQVEIPAGATAVLSSGRKLGAGKHVINAGR